MAEHITKSVAVKLLSVVDVGLTRGVGNPIPGQMCVEAAVCYALGLPHGDDPKCVARGVRSLKIRLNDSEWSSNEARASGLRRLALIQLGSADKIGDVEFAKRSAELVIRKMLPIAFRAAAGLQKNAKHKDATNAAAVRCETEGTEESARAAARAAAATSWQADVLIAQLNFAPTSA